MDPGVRQYGDVTAADFPKIFLPFQVIPSARAKPQQGLRESPRSFALLPHSPIRLIGG
jgi:hypothetical protein